MKIKKTLRWCSTDFAIHDIFTVTHLYIYSCEQTNMPTYVFCLLLDLPNLCKHIYWHVHILKHISIQPCLTCILIYNSQCGPNFHWVWQAHSGNYLSDYFITNDFQSSLKEAERASSWDVSISFACRWFFFLGRLSMHYKDKMRDFQVWPVFEHSDEVAKSKLKNVINFYSSNNDFSIELLNKQTVFWNHLWHASNYTRESL